MGYSGDFVLARSDSSLRDLPVFDDPEWCIEEQADYFHECRPRPGGWQTLQVNDCLPENDDDRWLHRLVAATGSPVMIASVMDSDVCYVRGLTPSGVAWATFLDPVMAADYEVTVPPHSEDEAPRGETDQGRRVRLLLANVPKAAEQIALWAAEGGFTADREALRAVLAKRADPFVEDVFFELVDACGLPLAAPVGEDPPATDLPVHPGHRPEQHCPRGARLEAAVLSLPRDGVIVLGCAVEADCFAQVWLRPDGTYELEYRDRSPAEHYQTRTVSADKVVAALAGWEAGGIAWRDAFQWNSIGSWFSDS
ncbi:hypothetical protein ABZ883_19105 [Streptomyces sp. NPDC046977]|uniref:hypothetical protein n=1 Tax=Streptomyces sp. NPDC046977 TaxID=3154703 RepID=UPI0033F14C28